MGRAVFAAFALVLTLVIVGATALAGAAPHDPAMSAVDGSGHRLGPDPVLRIGDHVVVTVRGFAPHGPVRVRASGIGAEYDVTADAHGVATVAIVVTAQLEPGSHALTLVGAPNVRRHAPAGNVRVLIPRVARFAFRVAAPGPDAGVGGVSTHRPHGGAHGGLAGTGLDVAGLVTLGVAALGVGAGTVAAARARRRRRA